MTPAQNTAAYIQGFEDGKRTAKAEFAKLLLEQSPQPKEPEQEPVAWGVDWGRAGDIPCVSIIKRLPKGGIEVMAVEYAPYSYTHPPQRTWVWLTDEQITQVIKSMPRGIKGWMSDWDLYEFSKAYEAKLKERNT